MGRAGLGVGVGLEYKQNLENGTGDDHAGNRPIYSSRGHQPAWSVVTEGDKSRSNELACNLLVI